MKSERFNLRMTPKEKQTITDKALKAKMPISEYLISTALNKQIIIIDTLPEMISELKAIGRNLNQLTTLSNMGKVQIVNLNGFTEKLTDIHLALKKLTEEVL